MTVDPKAETIAETTPSQELARIDSAVAGEAPVRRRRRIIAASIGAAGIAAAAIAYLATRPEAALADCDELAASIAPTTVARTQWVAAVREACAMRDGQAAVRLACLRDRRDELPLATYDEPDVQLCLSPTPIARPEPPAELAAQVRAVRSALVEPARALELATRAGWRPALAQAQLAVSDAAMLADDIPAARKALGIAIELARTSGDTLDEARARVRLAEIALDVLESPRDPGELDRLMGDARRAIAGREPVLGARLAIVEAEVAIGHDRFTPAIEDLDAARAVLLAHRQHRRATIATLAEVDALTVRDRRDDLVTAARILGTLRTALDGAHLAALPSVIRLQGHVAWRRRMFDEAHALYDAVAPKVPRGIPRTGHVTGVDGGPAKHALVATWSGTLYGDRTRVAIDPHMLGEGELVTTDDNGDFAISVPREGAIIAGLGDARSIPRRVTRDEDLQLQLQPTKAFSSTIDIRTARRGLEMHARYALADDTTWIAAAPVAPDGRFTLDTLPSAAFAPQLSGSVGESATRTLPAPEPQLVWDGAPVDAVIRLSRPGPAIVWLVAGVHEIPKTHADVERLLATHDGVRGHARTLGARDLDATTAAAPGDRHLGARLAPSASLLACAVQANPLPPDMPVACTLRESAAGDVIVQLP